MRTIGRSLPLWLFPSIMIAVIAFGGEAGAAQARGILPAEAGRRLQSGERIVIVDTRLELERDMDGHISGDVSVPLMPKEQFAANIQRAVPDKSVTVFTYCKHGKVDGISSQAAVIMAGLGYANVFYISGGYDGWPYEKVK